MDRKKIVLNEPSQTDNSLNTAKANFSTLNKEPTKRFKLSTFVSQHYCEIVWTCVFLMLVFAVLNIFL